MLTSCVDRTYLLLVMVSVAPSPLSAAVSLSAATSSFVSAAAAFMLSTAAPLPLSTPAALPVTTAAALLPFGHTKANERATEQPFRGQMLFTVIHDVADGDSSAAEFVLITAQIQNTWL